MPHKIRALLIDDEKSVRNTCKAYLQERDDINLLGECDNIKDAEILIRATAPHLVFLDIRLGDGTGFELLSRFEVITFRIIFITAYEQYALAAIKAGALDYLLKPVSEEEFHKAIDKVRNEASAVPSQIAAAQEGLDKKKIEKIIIKAHEGTYIIWLAELVYCKSDSSYTTFFLTDKSKIMTAKTIREFEDILPAESFIRCHHSYIINIHFAKKLTKDNLLQLKNDAEIPVSIRKKEELLRKLS